MLECCFRTSSARLGGPRLWGRSTRSSRSGYPQLGQTSAREVSVVRASAAGVWRSAVRCCSTNCPRMRARVALARTEQAVIAHLDEAFGQDVLEKTPDERL